MEKLISIFLLHDGYRVPIQHGEYFWYLLLLQWQMRVTARTLTFSVLMSSSGLCLRLHD